MADKDLFGFDEFDKALKKAITKYPQKTDALLVSAGNVTNKSTKSKTPIGKTKKLRPSWRVLKPKTYGQTRVVRVQSGAPHAHLVEQGHRIVRGGRLRKGGREMNALQRAVRGISIKGEVEGKKMLESSMKEITSRFNTDLDKMVDDLLKDVEL